MPRVQSINFSSQTRKFLSFVLLIIVLSTPILLWLFAGPPIRITSNSALFGAIGQLCAIVGVVLFALQFVLAARYKIIEALLRGLNRVYTVHHMLGGLAFILILFHPVSFFTQYALLSLNAAIRFLFPPFTQIGIWLGLTALTLLIILLVITYFAKLKYETWKFTHQFLGISFIIAFAHTLLVPSTLTVNFPLKLYLVGVYSLGTFSFLYQKVFKPIFAKKILFTVTKITKHPDSIHEVFLSPLSSSLNYKPGQFAFLTFKSKNVIKQTHPFSFTSYPGQQHVSFAIKSVGDFTSSISSLKVGDQALIEGPYGHFTQEHITNPNQIWIAGGIGITPFLSFIRSFNQKSIQNIKHIHLFYSVKIASAAFKEELSKTAKRHSSFNFVIHNSSNLGHLTINSIIKKIPHAQSYDILLCGPLPMMKSLQKQAKELGYSASQLHSEEFRLYN